MRRKWTENKERRGKEEKPRMKNPNLKDLVNILYNVMNESTERERQQKKGEKSRPLRRFLINERNIKR